MHKLLALGVFLAFFAGFVSAADYSMGWSSVEVDYPYSGFSLGVSCSGGDCPSHGRLSGKTVSLRVCGEKVSEIGGYGSNAAQPPYNFDDFDIPYDAPCGYGSHTPVFVDSDRNRHRLDGEIVVSEKGSMDPHVGKNIIVNVAPSRGSSGELRAFQLTDDTWDEADSDMPSPSQDSGNIMVQRFTTSPCAGAPGCAKHQQEVYSGGYGRLADRYDSLFDLTHGGCSGDVCTDVVDKSFTSSNSFHFGVWASLDTISPLHDDSNYRPDGEILYGYYPEYYVFQDCYSGRTCPPGGPTYTPGTDSGDGPYFFVCRDGATMDNGKEEVDQVVDIRPENDISYQCNQLTNSWELVNQCEDGLDNDGDGQIDFPEDEKCVSNEGKETTENPCPERAVNQTVNGEGKIVAQYWDRVDEECSTDKPIDSGDLYENWVDEPKQMICSEQQPSYNNPQGCGGINWGPYTLNGEGSGIMPIAIYYAEKEYFKDLAHVQGVDLEEDGVETDFVGRYGWRSQSQTLYEAEMKYEGRGSDSFCSSCHEYEQWEDRITEPEASEAYNQSFDYSNHLDAWGGGTVHNAGAKNSEVLSVPTEDSVFEGGFAGICDDDTFWRYDANKLYEHWRCSASVPWDMAIHLPETSGMHSGTEVGFIVPPYIAMEDQSDYPEFIPREITGAPAAFNALADKRIELETFDAWCWAGTLDDYAGHDSFSEMISNSNSGEDYIHDEDLQVSSSEPFGFAGNVKSMKDYDTYACRIEITAVDQDGSKINLMGGDKGDGIRPIELQHDSELRSGFTNHYNNWVETYGDGELNNFVG